MWVYATWCGFCHRFLPVWKDLAVMAPADVTLYTVDASEGLGEVIPENYPEITGFPTILIYRDGHKIPTVFTGERTAEKILSMVREEV